MGKKFIKRMLVLIAAVCMLVGTALPVYAEETGAASATVTGTTEDPANGILQVMLAYVDDSGNRTYFTGGTCFLINEEYVVTNKHIFDLDTVDEETKLTTREIIMLTLDLDELPDNDPHLKLYVFANRDTNVEATVHENAQSDVLDFAALHLSEKIYGREPLVLGDSDTISQRDNVYAYGFPEDSIQNKKFNTKDDVSISSGIISKVTVTGSVDVIEHTSQLNNGNSGGPLLNDAGEVIGINEFIVDQKNYSIQINAVKEILDTWGIPYPSGGGSISAELTLDDLRSEIDSARALDLSRYTEESAQEFRNAIDAAEEVAASNPDETAIQSAIDDLSVARSGLVPNPEDDIDDENGAGNKETEKDTPNYFLIGGIILGAVVLIVVIVIIIVAVNSSKKKKAQEARLTPPEPFSPVNGNMPNTPPAGYQSGASMTMPPQEAEGAGETTLLDSGAGETTLLGGGAGSAYLIRKKNGERITITSQNFAIGKERRRVNYCISDNTSVSRYHVVITKKGSDYYAADQKSSNFTFVNGVQLSPYQETLLTDRSTLKISDEEFEFHLS